jgi:hypothetical protein
MSMMGETIQESSRKFLISKDLYPVSEIELIKNPLPTWGEGRVRGPRSPCESHKTGKVFSTHAYSNIPTTLQYILFSNSNCIFILPGVLSIQQFTIS